MIKQFGLTIALCCFATTAATESNFSRYEIKNLLRTKISSIQDVVKNPELIREVKSHNDKNLSLQSILKIDAQWKASNQLSPVKTTMYTGKTCHYLKALVEFDNSIFSEIFLTDNQGANICAWPLTSDYWQGDEAKWSQAFNHGKGDIYIGNLEFDTSSNTNAIQISVPVMEKGKAIGVLVAGIKLTYLQAKYLNSTQ